ncbi:amidohydrolase [Alkalibacterium kapii]|uniref:Amidohydrolase n=1 Tax=Alkalibacterium kapii TaxID=426704 RepID=A0A511AQQ7_9LACT|nr:amidohydrolase [Alkalibacterium kapii]GEK90534.1 amidohydrolase [Alkalibacterium kapii]
MKAFINGKIYVERNTFTEAFVIEDNRILKTGSNKTCLQLISETEKYSVIDLKGKTVLPGFIDSHLHFLMTSEYLNLLPIADVTSIEALIKRCQDYIRDNRLTDKDILYTEGWNHTSFTDEKRMPDRLDLDKISETVPVVLTRVDRHVMSLNTAALVYFGIDEATKPPLNGEIQKDASNKPSGILTEGAVDLVKSKLPKKSRRERKKQLVKTMHSANKVGLTSVHTNDAKDDNIAETLTLYEELENEGKLTLRFYQQIWFNNEIYLSDFFKSRYAFHEGTAWNKIGPVKFFIDGTLGSRTAALRKPYTDNNESRGLLTKSEETLYKEVKKAVENDYQVITHAIGDRGIETVLNAYDKVEKNQLNPLRLGINHMQITDYELIERVKEKGYLVYVQPIFLNDDIPIIHERIGKERASTSYLFKTMKDKGIHQSFSSDAPIVSFNPFYNIQCAVTRKRLDSSDDYPYLPEEAMDIFDAVDAYTYEGAYASFEETRKGRLKEGYLADFIILDKDIFQCEAAEIKTITVAATYVDGTCVYKSGGFDEKQVDN